MSETTQQVQPYPGPEARTLEERPFTWAEVLARYGLEQETEIERSTA